MSSGCPDVPSNILRYSRQEKRSSSAEMSGRTSGDAMAEKNAIELAPADVTSELVQTPGPLLDLTIDQLRTLVIVHREGNALRAARILGREQSSVQKQLNTVNDASRHLVGESLFIKQ